MSPSRLPEGLGRWIIVNPPSGAKSINLVLGISLQLLDRLLRSQRCCIPFRNAFPTMYSTSQGAQGIPNMSKYEQKYNNFRFSSPKAATNMVVSSTESHNLTQFYELFTADF